MRRTQPSDHERGATLLSVLLIIVLMSTAALAATDALARSVSVSRVSASRADSFWATRGALSVGEVLVNEALAGTEGLLVAESPLFREPIVFAYARGSVRVELYEATNCLNLNALIIGSDESQTGTVSSRQLHRMLEGAGLFNTEAHHLVDSLLDWMDADASPRASGAEDGAYLGSEVPHRTPGQRLTSVTDLRAIEHFTPDVMDAISDLVCVRSTSDDAPLNINTLSPEQAPLLAARFSDELSVSETEQLILSRPEGGWLSVDEFLLSRDVASITPKLRNERELSTRSAQIGARIAVTSDNGTIRIDATYGRGTDGIYVLKGSNRRSG
jgi:general secretion pathway protein K